MSSRAAPSARQLAYLRVLAARTATTFVNPATRAEASSEIARLLHLERAPRENRLEHDEPPGVDLLYATAVRSEELTGHGSSARWRSAPRPAPSVAPARRELARYRVSTGARVLSAERRGGRLHLTDSPAERAGETYTVDQLSTEESQAPVDALVRDYLARARELDDIPMSAAALRATLSMDRADG